jgi:hypothetical protein
MEKAFAIAGHFVNVRCRGGGGGGVGFLREGMAR